MVINKEVLMTEDDLFQAIRGYLAIRLQIPPSDVCNVKYNGNSQVVAVVQLQQENVKS